MFLRKRIGHSLNSGSQHYIPSFHMNGGAAANMGGPAIDKGGPSNRTLCSRELATPYFPQYISNAGNSSTHENGPTRCQSIHWRYLLAVGVLNPSSMAHISLPELGAFYSTRIFPTYYYSTCPPEFRGIDDWSHRMMP